MFLTFRHPDRKTLSPWSRPVAAALFLSVVLACAPAQVKAPVRVADSIVLLEGYRKGKLSYAEDEMKDAKVPERKSLLDHLNPNYQDTNLSIYAGRKTRRLYFDNAMGGEVYLLKIFQDDRLVQECDEPEYSETTVPGGGGFIANPAGGGAPIFVGGGPDEKKVKPVHDIRCILKGKADSLDVEAHAPEGLMSKYRVYLKSAP